MSLFVLVHSDTTEQELREIVAFKRQTLQMYLQVGREVLSVVSYRVVSFKKRVWGVGYAFFARALVGL